MLQLLGKIFISWGSLGSKQMCVGFFHEIKVPEELEKTDF